MHWIEGHVPIKGNNPQGWYGANGWYHQEEKISKNFNIKEKKDTNVYILTFLCFNERQKTETICLIITMCLQENIL